MWVPCSEAEKHATPKGWEDFGRHLCNQFKRDGYNVWPIRVRVADGASDHPNFIQATSPPRAKKLLTLAEVPPDIRLPGELGTEEDDLCGCGTGHGWDPKDFACSRDLEPSISPGLESRICSKFGHVEPKVSNVKGKGAGSSTADNGAFDDHPADAEKPAQFPEEVPLYVRPLEVQVVKDPQGMKGNFLKVIPSNALKGRDFMMAVFSNDTPPGGVAHTEREGSKAA